MCAWSLWSWCDSGYNHKWWSRLWEKWFGCTCLQLSLGVCLATWWQDFSKFDRLLWANYTILIGCSFDLFATLLWFLVALWSPVTIVAWFSFLTDSPDSGGCSSGPWWKGFIWTLHTDNADSVDSVDDSANIKKLIDGNDLLVRCGTLVFVAGLIGGATFLLVTERK